MSELDRLVAVMARLRGPGGCPWDAEQTHESLLRYLIEETAELVEAVEGDDPVAMREELGDVLYQVLFHADLAAAEHGFDIEDVARDTAAKMIGRHPHVFGDAQAADAEAVVVLWEERKRIEKADRVSVLDGVPMTMPSLLLADEEALGDALLDTVIAASAVGLDAERALRGAIRRLTTRIRAAESGPDESPHSGGLPPSATISP